jgi:hypothetical protein
MGSCARVALRRPLLRSTTIAEAPGMQKAPGRGALCEAVKGAVAAAPNLRA